MISGYKCDYCNNFDSDANIINKHEHTCKYNPVNQTCFTCGKVIEEPGLYHELRCSVSGNSCVNREFTNYIKPCNDYIVTTEF